MAPNKAEARRLAKAALEEAKKVPELPEALMVEVEAYEPFGVTDEAWAEVRPHFVEVMVRSQVKSTRDAKKHRVVLGPYLVWRRDQGLSTEPKVAMTFVAVDAYYQRHLLTTVAKSTANDYRSLLRRLAQRANPGLDAPQVATIGHIPVRPGYTEAEMAAFVRIARRQRLATPRRRLCAVVGLCAGAGLSPDDFRHLTVSAVVDLGDDGIRVDVGGRRPRTVWVRHDFEHLVRAGVAGLGPDQLVLGRDVNRRNITTKSTHEAELDGCPVPDAARLRNTWLSWLMCQPVPLAVILDAAGLTSARTLTDLLPHVQLPETGTDALRGAGR